MDRFLPICVVLVATFLAVQSVRYKDCGSKEGKVKSISVTGCESSNICNLKKGQNYTISVDFTTNEDAQKATAVVHGILSHIPVPFPINNPDGCKDSGLTCPLKKGDQESYHSVIFVESEYPKVKVVVKWELQDENKNDLFCIEVPAQVVDGDKNKGRKSANHIDNTLRFKPRA